MVESTWSGVSLYNKTAQLPQKRKAVPTVETDTKPTRAIKNRHKTPTASYSKQR